MSIKSVFLDTNIIVDLLETSRPNHAKALQLIDKIILADVNIFISEDMLSTIYYIIKNKNNTCSAFQEILAQWQIATFGANVIKRALKMCINNPNLDLEDTLQCLCAKQNQCDLLISNDKNFIDCGIKIVNYEQFNQIK